MADALALEMFRMVRLQVTPAGAAFFARTNLETLQGSLRRLVLQKTGHVISPQGEQDMLALMRSTYLQHARIPSSDARVGAEVERLNAIVLGTALPSVLTNLRSHLIYLRDASRPASHLSRPINTSQTGNRLGTQNPAF